jgi:hypothetical protein
LAEECEEDDKRFEILAWWKGQSSRFPILSKLARDVLAIQISTVASESAFSTGGRVLDDFRTSLTPFMVEALVCTQDWLRRSTPINLSENTEELTNYQEGENFISLSLYHCNLFCLLFSSLKKYSLLLLFIVLQS